MTPTASIPSVGPTEPVSTPETHRLMLAADRASVRIAKWGKPREPDPHRLLARRLCWGRPMSGRAIVALTVEDTVGCRRDRLPSDALPVPLDARAPAKSDNRFTGFWQD
jgi:hypothetical protein